MVRPITNAKKVAKISESARRSIENVKKYNVQPIPKPPGYVFGQPTKYRAEMCEQLIDHMSGGYSFKSFAATVGCSEDVLIDWVKKYPDFAAAKKQGKVLERLSWEQLHRRVCETNSGSMQGIIWAQKNKFPDDYKDESQTINVNTQTNFNTVNFIWDKAAEEKLRALEKKEKEIEVLKNEDILALL